MFLSKWTDIRHRSLIGTYITCCEMHLNHYVQTLVKRFYVKLLFSFTFNNNDNYFTHLKVVSYTAEFFFLLQYMFGNGEIISIWGVRITRKSIDTILKIWLITRSFNWFVTDESRVCINYSICKEQYLIRLSPNLIWPIYQRFHRLLKI